MRVSSSRSGMTLAEILVALGIVGVLVLGVWSSFAMVRTQASQVREFSSVLQTASSLLARLELDTASMILPNGSARSVVVEDEGRVLRFFRTAGSVDARTQPTDEIEIYSVQYQLAARSGGAGLVMTRRASTLAGEQVQEWKSFPIQAARFSTDDYRGDPFIYLELLFQDPGTGTDPNASKAALPIRWMHHIPLHEPVGPRTPLPSVFHNGGIPVPVPVGPTQTVDL